MTNSIKALSLSTILLARGSTVSAAAPPVIKEGPASQTVLAGADVILNTVFNEPFFSRMPVLGTAGLRLNIKAPLNSVVRLEVSNDLQAWTPLIRLTNSAGILEVTDPQPASFTADSIERCKGNDCHTTQPSKEIE